MAEGFKKPFKAVPLKPKTAKAEAELRDFNSRSRGGGAVNWTYVAVGLFIGVCIGLAYVINARG